MATQVYRHLTDDGLVGDGTNHLANVNGSVTPAQYYAGPAAGKVWEIHRMLILVEDNAVFNAEGYGGLSALTNGITMQLMTGGKDGTEEVDFFDGDPVKHVLDWGKMAWNYTYHDHGAGNNFILVNWNFDDAGQPLVLEGNANDVLLVTINDDLSTLVEHEFAIQGEEFSTNDPRSVGAQ